MDRFKGLLSRFEIHTPALALGTLFLSRPLIGAFEHKHPGNIPAYIFLIRIILIAILIFISRSIRARER